MASQTILSSRDFNQDVSRAKRAAENGPVVITDRGKPAYVLLRHADYEAMTQPQRSLLDALHSPAAAAVELELRPVVVDLKPVHFD